MNERMDEGDILLQRPTPIGAEETYGALQIRLAEIGAAALMDALDALTAGTLTPAPQDHARATLAPMISKAQGAIDWRDSATLIERRVRAFNPWPSAYTTLRGKLLKIHVARVETGPGEAGRIVDVSDAIRVATGDGILAIESLQLEGRKAMGAIEFAHGGALAAGEQLGAQGATGEPRRLAWRVLTAVEDGAFADAVLGGTSAARIWTARPRLATARLARCLAGALDHVWRASARAAASMRTCGRCCGSRCSRSSSSTACRSSPPSTRPSISRRRSRAARRAAGQRRPARFLREGGRWRCRRIRPRPSPGGGDVAPALAGRALARRARAR